MASEFDHLFLWTSIGAPEADRLAAFGLTEGPPNTHPGQGTACRRFFFGNAYLELLWVHDPAEAQSSTVKPIHLFERWSGRSGGACPFGFCFRPAAGCEDGPPFSAWEYRPTYLPSPLCISVAANSGVVTEPAMFFLPFGKRPDTHPKTDRRVLAHACGLSQITRIELAAPPWGSISPELQAVVQAGLVRLRAGTKYLAELGFDGELQGKLADFRPALPLVFRW